MLLMCVSTVRSRLLYLDVMMLNHIDNFWNNQLAILFLPYVIGLCMLEKCSQVVISMVLIIM